MDITPSRGMNEKEPFRQRERLKWALALIALLATVWIWISWRYALFPFASSAITPEQRLQAVLDSLTAPAGSPENDVPQQMLDSLTAPE